MLIVFAAAIVGVLVEAFASVRARRVAGLLVALSGLLGAFVFVVNLAGERDILARGAVAIDGPALFLQGVILALAATSLLVMAERPHDDESPTAARALRPVHTEAFPLAMFSVGGMMLFVSANNLIVMFIALEVLSLPLYLLCGLARRRRLISQESALKYFLLGAFSSAFFLYGIALLYGYAGSVSLSDLAGATAVPTSNEALLYAGFALLAVGLLFKAGAAPFHFWTPDVYQGAPTGVTALMAACTKVAAFGAILRVMLVPFYSIRADWRVSMAAVAILTMVVGAVIAVTQTDVKRMLAYSSVAHAGFILTGVAASNREGLKGSMFYLAAYGFTVIGGFAVVTLVRDAGGEATHLSRWQGLGKRSPAVAGLFAFFLFALAGIPLTSGFTGKFAVFQAAIDGGATYLVIIGVVTSAIAAFFYARVVVLMFFQEPATDGPTVVSPPALTSAALALSVVATIVLGVYPSILLDVAASADQFIR
ncbi:MAG: NADH-quinone oxidoreductase subunit NuoN [Mycobacteriales bacterium]